MEDLENAERAVLNLTLVVENGNYKYKTGPQILKDINIEAKSGEILAVLGPNGAGKTTLLRCMMDMLRWSSGRSILDGEDIHGMAPGRLWSRMAYVPQARTAASSYTAFQMVLLGRSSRLGFFASPSAKDENIAESVMRRLGIWELADKQCYAISGGELQMVLIARAMAAEPQVLVLDEPESNLDFRNQLIVLDTLTALAEEGVTCIFNTHYPSHALQRSHRSLILAKGGESIYGNTSSVVTEENIRAAFGVNAVIGEIETDESLLRSVHPVSLAENRSTSLYEDKTAELSDEENHITSSCEDKAAGLYGEENHITSLCEDKAAELSGEVNHITSSCEDNVAGRSGRKNHITSSYEDNVTELSGKENCSCSLTENAVASVSIIMDNNDTAGRINALLHSYNHLLIGRMGMPHRKRGLYIINVNLDGDRTEIAELTHRLGLIPGISVKTTYARVSGSSVRMTETGQR